MSYEIYIAVISSFKVITYMYPLGLLLLTPLSYCVFAWAGREQDTKDQQVDLEKAWRNMGLNEDPDVSSEELETLDFPHNTATQAKKMILSSTGGMYSLAELYANRINQSGKKWKKDSESHYKQQIYYEGDPTTDIDEENFTFVPKPSYVAENLTQPGTQGILSSSVERFTLWMSKPWEVLFGLILPHNKYPGVSFFMIIGFCFIISDLQLSMADGIIAYLGFNSSFIALTFYNLFSNMPDLLTVYTAAKNKEFTLALATIFSSQVLNLQFSLMLPWLLRCVLWGGYSSTPSDMQNMSMLSAVVILAVIAILLPLNRYRLNAAFGVLLLMLYIGYVYLVHKFV